MLYKSRKTIKDDLSQEVDKEFGRKLDNEGNNVRFTTPSMSESVDNNEAVGDLSQEVDKEFGGKLNNEENNVKLITPSMSEAVDNTEAVGGENNEKFVTPSMCEDFDDSKVVGRESCYLPVPCVNRRRRPVRCWESTCRVFSVEFPSCQPWLVV